MNLVETSLIQRPLQFRPVRRTLPKRARPRYHDDDSDLHDNTISVLESYSDDEADFSNAVGIVCDPKAMNPTDWELDARMNEISMIGPDNSNLADLSNGLPLLRFSRMLARAGYGEVLLPGAVFGDLKDDIHPIFQQANWIRERRFGIQNNGTNDTLWRRLQPALKLASKFITESKLLAWWTRALLGRKVQDTKTGKYYLLNPINTKMRGEERVKRQLEKLVCRVRWQFCSILPHSKGQHTHGIFARDLRTLDQHCSRRDFSNIPKFADFSESLHIGIHRSFRTWLLSPNYDIHQNPCMALKVAWFLAITMTHELAHAFYASKEVDCSLQEPHFEAWDHQNEIGWSWESSLLGIGKLQSFIDDKYGIVSLQWSPAVYSSQHPNVIIDGMMKWPVGPYYIYSFFQKDTWTLLQAVSDVKSKTFWQIPEPRVAVTSAPESKDDLHPSWIWVSSEYPTSHRLSIRHWQLKTEGWLKRMLDEKEIEKTRAITKEGRPDV